VGNCDYADCTPPELKVSPIKNSTSSRFINPLSAMVLIVVLDLALRTCMALWTDGSFDADEAVTGIMVKRILAGQQQYVFFAGQQYNGSLEQYLQAAMYFVFHLPQNPFTLRLVEVFLSGLTTVATYLVGRHVIANRWGAVLAAAFFAMGPYWSVLLGIKSYGAYSSVELLAALGVLFALRATGFTFGAERQAVRPWVLVGWTAGFALCCGLTVWLGLSGLEVLVAAGLWILPAVVRSIRAIIVAVVALLVGAAPLLVWMVRHGGTIPSVGGPQPPTTVLMRLKDLVHIVLPEYLGIGNADSSSIGATHAFDAIAAILLLLLLAAVFVRRRGMLAVLTLRSGQRASIDLIILIIPVAVLIYLISTHSWFTGNPRYLYVLFPITAVAAASGFCWIRARVAGRRPWRIAVSTVAIGVIAIGFADSAFYPSMYPSNEDNVSMANLQNAVRYLQKDGPHDVYAEYWVAVPAQYLAENSRVNVAPWKTGAAKSQASSDAVAAAPSFGYLLADRSGTPSAADFAQILTAAGVTYKRVTIGKATVFENLHPDLTPSQLHLEG
jgi:hypothetical protein